VGHFSEIKWVISIEIEQLGQTQEGGIYERTKGTKPKNTRDDYLLHPDVQSDRPEQDTESNRTNTCGADRKLPRARMQLGQSIAQRILRVWAVPSGSSNQAAAIHAHHSCASRPLRKTEFISSRLALSENKEDISHYANVLASDPSLSLQGQMQLIEGGDPRFLMFFAQEEKSQLLSASDHLPFNRKNRERFISIKKI